MKKIIAMMLCLTMLGCSLTAFGGVFAVGNDAPSGTGISTVEEFLAMSSAGEYYLTKDIDFSGTTYNKVVYPHTFTGVLDGNGFALLGITVTATNSDAGIFANQFHGTLKNLTIGSAEAPVSVSSTGSPYSVAAVAGTMTNGATFENVKIYANVKGDGKTAAFTSYMPNGKITIKNCAVYGDIAGNPAAGFVTMSNGGSCDIEIRDSANYANVSAGNLSAGGFYTIDASGGGSRHTNMVITGCINYGTISATDWRVGGIVGEFNEEKTSTLTVDYCYNMGFITMKGGGGYAGGIVGGLGFDPPSAKRTITNVYNVGIVTNSGNAQRAYALCSSDKTSDNLTITNGAYLANCASNPDVPCNNTKATNIKEVKDAKEMFDAVSAYERSEEGNVFVADTAKMNEGYPILARQALSHENVTTYECGRRYCNDCRTIISSPEEENHKNSDKTTEPDGYLDGYTVSTCSACGHTETKRGTPSSYTVTAVDGVYEMASADSLRWYAANLNAGLLTGKESLKLTADIDLSGIDFVPIGTKKNPYCGSFDGAFHTIKALKVTSEDVGGLFGYAARGAVFTNVTFDAPEVTAENSAGALLGEAVSASVVTVDSVAVANAKITSKAGAAGSLIGSTAFALEVNVTAVVSNKATIGGATAGGVIGNGTNSILKSVYVNATLTSSTNTTGALAYHGGRFSEKNCYYVRNQMASVSNGSLAKAEWFSDGTVAYQLNAFENNYVFGLANGTTVLSENAVRMIRFGAKKVYTDKILASKDDIAVYAAKTDKGVSLAIVIDFASKVKLPDLTITVKDGDKSETVAFGDLTLTRYLAVGDGYYTTVNGDALYTVTLDGVSETATYQIGTVYNAAADIVK